MGKSNIEENVALFLMSLSIFRYTTCRTRDFEFWILNFGLVLLN